ncbi:MULTISPECIES: siderophore-interacting protein [unclassified Microcella]|uniref:siderophore-interacting protein n=1 Tax=unclassified Microcella TaxID=2630066 RepID=UPI0006FEA185|nr:MULTISPECIES: siderophore-interacting protein [unclassified Microcella]KQV26303.1 hypothetical protein ASC54_05220 [Yonghaparkia sp. Root332]KRF32913.1 hypothetical protein ASG83_02525 [Yonghaparkia sp. Soil809]
MPFTLTRHPFPPRRRQVRLAARTDLVPRAADGAGFIRIRLQSGVPLDGFTSPGAGDHLRVFVPEAPEWASVAVDDAGHPTAPSRTETIVAFDAEAGWVDLDILVHAADETGDAGLIGPWAARAPLGSPAMLADPKGSVVLGGAPVAFVLAGDDSAIPALRRYLGMFGAGTPGLVLLETAFDPAALGVAVGPGVELRVLAPDPARPSAALAAELAALAGEPPPAASPDVFIFACGEQSLLAPARALLAAWGIDVEHAVAKGYWKRRAD